MADDLPLDPLTLFRGPSLKACVFWPLTPLLGVPGMILSSILQPCSRRKMRKSKIIALGAKKRLRRLRLDCQCMWLRGHLRGNTMVFLLQYIGVSKNSALKRFWRLALTLVRTGWEMYQTDVMSMIPFVGGAPAWLTAHRWSYPTFLGSAQSDPRGFLVPWPGAETQRHHQALSQGSMSFLLAKPCGNQMWQRTLSWLVVWNFFLFSIYWE